LLEGKYDFTKDPELAEKVDDCLLCGSCTVACPSSVKTDEIMVAARNDFVTNRGLKLFQKLVYGGLLPRKERLERVTSLMRLYEKSGARNVLYGKVLRRAFDRLVYYESFLPDNLSKPARLGLGPIVRPSSAPKIKIAFFLGCASNAFWGRTVRDSLSYLISRGALIHIPPTTCCGEPHRSSGDLTETKKLALKNSELIFKEEYEAIVTDCSTCAKALSRYDEFVGPDSKEGERVRALLGRVVDLNTFVVERLGLRTEDLKPTGFGTVTYHDSCHAIRGLGIREAPRAILSAIPGLAFREMEGADSCCGGAGSYGFTHPTMSGRIAADKAAKIAKSGADVLSTSCPACALQLGAGLKRAWKTVPILHPVELLAHSAGVAESVPPTIGHAGDRQAKVDKRERRP
jgi:glycolate oxidase iron-sulfur subunit